MFCPNCGTQNPETAQICGKCNFNLKGAAAPKFKGTMLMMNQQGAQTPAPPGAVPQSAPPGPPPVSGAPPRPSNAGPAAPSKLKGTMVGVAPPMAPVMGKPGAPVTSPPAYAPQPGAFGAPMDQQPPMPPPPPPAAFGAPPQQQAQQGFGAPPPQQGFGAPPPQQAFGAPQQVQQGFGAPPPQQQQFGGGQGVNPLGGTMVADQSAYQGNSYGAPQAAPPPQQYGAPPPQQYGAPPQQQYGAPPPQQYGAPPQQQYGAPPQQQYGAPPPDPGAYGGGGYGAPPQAQPAYGAPPPPGAMPYGAPPGAMQPAGGGGMQGAAGGLLSAVLSGGTRPTVRNPMMVLVVPFGLMGAGIIISIIFSFLGMIFALLGGLISLACCIGGVVLLFIAMIKMVNEVKSVTRNNAFAWWPLIVPLYNYYWLWILLPQEVTNAKRTVGLQQPARPIVHYIFIAPYALAADINEIAARTG